MKIWIRMNNGLTFSDVSLFMKRIRFYDEYHKMCDSDYTDTRVFSYHRYIFIKRLIKKNI